MNNNIKLKDLLEETDALTYINSLKVTLSELKAEFSKIEEMQGYINQGCERSRKLLKKADNQYRLIAKLVQDNKPITAEVNVDDELELMEIMEQTNE